MAKISLPNDELRDATPAELADFEALLAARIAREKAETVVAYRRKRRADYRDELGKEPGDEINTIGDILDLALVQIEANRVTSGAAPVAGWAEMLAKIDDIKQRHPKPRAGS